MKNPKTTLHLIKSPKLRSQTQLQQKINYSEFAYPVEGSYSAVYVLPEPPAYWLGSNAEKVVVMFPVLCSRNPAAATMGHGITELHWPIIAFA